MGRTDEALAALRRAIELDPDAVSPVAASALAHAAAGRRAEARSVLERLLAERGRRYVPEGDLAAIHLALGEVDEAFAWLERALHERDGQMPYLAVDPLFDRIRSDDRFGKLLRTMGLP